MNGNKPQIQQRQAMVAKGEATESDEPEGKPVLNRPVAKLSSRQERILSGLERLDEIRLAKVLTAIGADELAVAVLDLDVSTKNRLAANLTPEGLVLFQQYLDLGKDKLPSSVVEEVQGKLLRLLG